MDHNKKRNTAFLYEALTKELAKCRLDDNKKRGKRVQDLLVEFFSKGKIMNSDLDLYQSIYETEGAMPHIAEKILQEAKRKKDRIDDDRLFNEQSRLLNRIDKDLDKDVYDNFISNYKSLATIYQILNDADIKSRKKVILEDKLTRMMMNEDDDNQELEPLDRLTYLKFVEKFNEKYGSSLIKEQKDLLKKYIYSANNEQSEFKYFISKELGRLKEGLNEALESAEELREDDEMRKKTEDVLQELEKFSEKAMIEESDLAKIMKTQELVNEFDG